MTSHLELATHGTTTPDEVARFIRSAASNDRSDGKCHLRARKTMHTPPGGRPYAVTILFVRSGRENPVEWFRNAWFRDRQYRLAQSLLHEVAERALDLGSRPAAIDSQANDYGIVLMSALRRFEGKALPLEALHKTLRAAQPRWRSGTAGAGAPVMSQDVMDSVAYLHYAPVTQMKFATFLKVSTAEKKALERDFESFARLSQYLYKSALPAERFPHLIRRTRIPAALLKGALEFSQRWIDCWHSDAKAHDTMRYSQVAAVDSFVLWLARNYLGESVDATVIDQLSERKQGVGDWKDAMDSNADSWKAAADRQRAMHEAALNHRIDTMKAVKATRTEPRAGRLELGSLEG